MPVENGQRAVRQLGGEMREIGCFCRGIDDEKEPLATGFVVEPRHHQIVENMALAIEQLGIPHLAWSKRRDFARHQSLQAARGVRPRENRLAHVRNIEQSSTRAREKMFGDDSRRILHRHGIAGKTGHAGAKRAMYIVKRSAGEIVPSVVGGGLAIGHRNTWPGKVMASARRQKPSRFAPSVPEPERFPSRGKCFRAALPPSVDFPF